MMALCDQGMVARARNAPSHGSFSPMGIGHVISDRTGAYLASAAKARSNSSSVLQCVAECVVVCCSVLHCVVFNLKLSKLSLSLSLSRSLARSLSCSLSLSLALSIFLSLSLCIHLVIIEIESQHALYHRCHVL